ncbi:MAG TPA: hypothetical protein VN524_09730 [Hyphomicrobiaceae bacterium]|jgi:hypothetical protein|nr:hypothetical protein [Hyphomicrobiaceae bacterium]
MALSILVLGTALTVLPLVAAGLMAAMVLLERREEQLAAAPAAGGRAPGRQRQRKPSGCRRG